LEAVSQLDQDVSIASAAIREWKNSFARINRIPTDILSLIPTYLSSQKDRFHAASVCRHWRGVFLKRAELWSQLFLIKVENYVSTLLERAKGSALNIIAHQDAPVGTIALISPRAQQIRDLEFVQNHWKDITAFSGFNSGRLPLLRSLKIETSDLHDQATLPLFRGSINLEQFVFHYDGLPYLSHFVFPNLTTFELSSCPEEEEEGNTLYLLDFLRASPTLQTVKMEISAPITLGGVSQDMVVALPNVETFSLHVESDLATDVYEIASHISCPRVRYMSLTHGVSDDDMNADLEVFPNHILWNMIVRHYVASPIEEVTLDFKRSDYVAIESFLTFRSLDAAVVRLGCKVIETDEDEDGLYMTRAAIGWEVFSRALRTIQGHPLPLSHVKRLHIKWRAAIWKIREVQRMLIEVQELFNSLGPLDEFTIGGCDLRIFIATFVDILALDDLDEPFEFPQIKHLKILHPSMETREMEWMNGIVELAKAQHERGMPFERVTVRMWSLPIGMAEELGRWVGAVDCREEWSIRL
jgi:hypothetical protein